MTKTAIGQCHYCRCEVLATTLDCSSCGEELLPTVHFSALSPEQAESLALIAEECAEVIHIISKIQRHGLHSYHPDAPYGRPNRDVLAKEVGDLLAALRIGEVQNLIGWAAVISARDEKMMSVSKWLHHAKTGLETG